LAVSCLALLIDLEYAWVVTAIGATADAIILALGYRRAFRYDPNAGDREASKYAGQELTIWGDQLTELLKNSPELPRVHSSSEDARLF
jgi:hypothetical protein